MKLAGVWGYQVPALQFLQDQKKQIADHRSFNIETDHCFRKMKSSNFYRNTYTTCTKEQQAQNKLLHMKDNSALFSIMQFTKDLKKSEVSGLLVILSIHSICSLTLMVITELV